MHTKKLFIFVSLILVLTLPLMAQGAAEKIPVLQKEGILPSYNDEEEAVAVEAKVIEETTLPTYGEVDTSSLTSRFSYSYGYMITSSLLEQGVSINGQYWLKGIKDGFDYFSGNFLIATEDMNDIVNEYISSYYNAGLTGEVGTPVREEDLDKLASPEELLDKFSYSYALIYIVQLYWMNGLDISLAEYMEGSAEALYLDAPLYMTEEEMESSISEYAEIVSAEYQAEIEALAASNLEEAEEFLKENENNEGIIKLESGNLLEIVSEDEELGATPGDEDSVIVDYDLFLLDGTQLDSAEDITFSLSSLIPGFVEAVENMKVGQECYVYIHPDYGYGESGTSSIEPNSLLIFRIYLKGIVKAEN